MTRVVVGMSGGVDSSVAAALLKEQGYDVVGIMLRLWSEPTDGVDGVERVAENKCCSLESVADARRVAARLDLPFYVVNVEEPFRETVVDYFYDEYAAGRTPNPCLRCNRQIRFTLLLERALALGAQYLATGHYARVDDDPLTGQRRLRRAVDESKDQSYVLHVLSQYQLRHALFPLGEFTKAQVRAMAAERGLSVASKPESQEICFVADRLPWVSAPLCRGDGARGPSLGADPGCRGTRARSARGPRQLHHWPAQGTGRHHARATARAPTRCRAQRADRGSGGGAGARGVQVAQTTFIGEPAPSAPFHAAIKVRYKAAPVASTVTPLPGGRARVELAQAQRAITPGQAAVFYGGERDEVALGGGLIEAVP